MIETPAVRSQPRLVDARMIPVVVILAALSAAFLFWFPPHWLSLGVLAFLIMLSLAAWLYFYKSSSVFMGRLQRYLSSREFREFDRLSQSLRELGIDQGSEQLSMLQQKYNDLMEVIKMRFKEGELAYQRYYAAAGTVFQSVSTNLREIEVAQSSIKSIDAEKLERKLDNDGNDQSRQALEQRLHLYQQQQEKTRNLLHENEAALTAMTRTATALANTQTDKATDAMAVEQAIEELERLAKRAKNYGR